jgi:hypothetical protein
MNPPSVLSSLNYSDISNRTIFQAKRVSSSALSTDATSLNFKSPSVKKPCFFLSPAPVSAKVQMKNENSMVSDRKRHRKDVNFTENKRTKNSYGPVTKIVTELYDPETGTTLGFRCFRENEVIRDKNVEKKIIINECDDDCPTDELQIEACVEYMFKEIELALTNYNN